VFIFGSVRFLSKKSNQTEFFFKKKPKPVQTDRFRFGSVRFFRAKTGSNWFGSVFSVWLGFFPVWLGFFSSFFRFGFGSGSVFSVPGLKNRNRTGWFFQNFNRFFFTVRFFRLFFFQFSWFNRFFGFFEYP